MNMRFFDYKHLPEHLQAVSKPFRDLAQELIVMERAPIEDGRPACSEEVEMCLRKLLEAKDCAVRARLEMEPQ